MSVTVLGTAVVVAGLLAPGASEASPTERGQVAVEPEMARPGERVEISVPGCARPRPAMSEAFTGRAVDGSATVRRDAEPDTYAIVAHCGSRRVTGEVRVAGRLVWPDILPTGQIDR